MEQLSFTIPYTSSAIRATVTALNQMDNDLNGVVGLFVATPTVEYREVPNAPAPLPHFDANVDPATFIPTPPPVGLEDDEPSYNSVEPTVDSAGTPWDTRIHSSSKALLKADGTWKLKKGVDKELVTQVMGNAQAPVATAQTATPTPPSATPPNVTTPLPPVAATTEAHVAPVGNGFRKLHSDIAKAGLAPAYVQEICLAVNGRPLSECISDMEALDALRSALGLDEA